MNILRQYPSRYLTIADLEDLGGEVTYTVKTVQVDEMGRDGVSEKKPAIYFREIGQALVVNKTNANTLAHDLGTDTVAWSGKKVTLSLEDYKPGQKWIAVHVSGAPRPKAAGPTRGTQPPTQEEAAVLAQKPLGNLLDDEVPF